MKIVFMGTPDFAVASLDALRKAGNEVLAVVTAADKPAGRGQKISESAVKKYAVANNLKVLQPLKLKDDGFIAELKSLNAELFVVVAFRMLPEIVWQMPPKGTINLHGSILPNYRGAAPINHAVINGETETGVTTFFLKQEIDTGDVIFTDTIEITDEDDAGTVHDKLMAIGANLLVKTVEAIEKNDYQEIPQKEGEALKFAPKIFKDFCKINWALPNQVVFNHIRGLSPYPTAFTYLNDKTLKVYQIEKEDITPTISAGDYLTDGKTYLKFATNDGYIKLIDVQMEGKKKMKIEDFLRGVRI